MRSRTKGCTSAFARTADALNEAVAALTKTRLAVVFVGDVTKPDDAQKWVDETVKKFGGIDVLVNNAGGARPGALAELPESAWREQFDLNLFAPVRLARLCAAHMEKRGGGSIINIGSIYGRESGGPLTYNASKAALHSFTKMLAREYAPKNIRATPLRPARSSLRAETGSGAFARARPSRRISSATRCRPGGWAVPTKSRTRW